jgi:hypothetical protein
MSELMSTLRSTATEDRPSCYEGQPHSRVYFHLR